MIIVKLKGGLGNQLFQYTVGRALAEIHKTELKLDISLFVNYEFHDYSMKPFNIQENIASNDEIESLKSRKLSVVQRLINKFLPAGLKFVPGYLTEKHFDFDPQILKLKNDVYLDGYWQSEKYFADIGEIVRREFTIKTLPEGKNQEVKESILSSESVSLHVRRGTYLLPQFNSVLEPCPLVYYEKCVKYISGIVDKPHFFIFSDDPEWVRENLILPYQSTYVDFNDGKNDFEDLRLMSLCKHNIIANSTFSWWGAWLNSNSKKIVLAPAKWFRDPKRKTKDLFPESWIKVDY
jgi:hypothetical protein